MGEGETVDARERERESIWSWSWDMSGILRPLAVERGEIGRGDGDMYIDEERALSEEELADDDDEEVEDVNAEDVDKEDDTKGDFVCVNSKSSISISVANTAARASSTVPCCAISWPSASADEKEQNEADVR